MSKRPRILLVSVCAAFALLTATTVPAFDGQEAGLIPGGGPVRSDCYVELKVVGIDNPGPDVRSGRVVSCADGDPCDIDGECGNGSCPFGVAVCINQTDPNLPACHAPTGLQKLFVNPPKLAGAVPGSLDGSACGSFGAIPLPLKNGTQPAMVQVRLSANATAAKGTSPRRDRDTFVLKCLPRTTPCPTTSTTTTSTSTSTTTSTTSTSTSTTTSTSSTTLETADLSLTKVASPTSIFPGSPMSVMFTVTLHNAGPATATGVEVTDLPPAAFTFDSSTASPGSYNSA